ncbi:adenosylmethionine--8-amino-7-oxononanoate transaminase [Chromobacterium subtsugae]|uniref:Adenosylmethionine-8-amino-7-oxononanoate aminotransferase n=2 Tax=Chromobacterium subtsugae TaxID=251747 RepID=A0ABS7FAM4_9NEIS|nr:MULTISPECIES: adenosylmethionine--8-amino-7-oxononanoate transaminase [Chromobacterium]KUM03128.1 adenosylmethionine-8-amino-7-oxononanoate aminotransferase [Chromobacterium subtsugae]KZE86553.1 adenosylmethionine-8-amino-7-oxononanoate aminotransferase [Chromobacterium sp. F49]MBW7564978.1 adenosylmethionine--8-amino-7-oxononanoate transaminase [Chromobacterium subtsugae]MBW8286495.1 adenosylmethionine--8-amino-7-oxononanoate transaminase [Chromobacterium subtsugae]WSE91462.1 adenosylmethi
MSNQAWLERSFAAVWHPCTQMKRHESLPIVPIASADGVWLTDFDGKRYLDGVSSWWVNLFGHGEPRIKQAIKRQLDSLEHVMLAGFTHQPVVELSERLAALSGLGRAFYGSDGASATEIALKMSFHYWKNRGQPGKTRFVSLENSYHGETVGALAVTDVPLFSSTYADLLKPGLRAPSPDARQAAPGETAADPARRAAAALENLLAKRAGEIAAVIVEPLVQGAAGMAMHDPAYLAELRRLCDRHQVHLIADEIAVGFGRTGTFFAYQQAGILPDFLCLSKGITGGFLPLSCVLTRDEIYQAFYHDDVARGFLHSHSYTGNALACSAALAVLDIFEADDVLAANREKAAEFTRRMRPLSSRPDIRHFRHTGMIWAFDVATERADFALAFFSAMLKRGCLLRPIGKTVYFMPPYTLNNEEMDWLVESSCSALDEVLAGGSQTAGAETPLP